MLLHLIQYVFENSCLFYSQTIYLFAGKTLK